MRLDRSTRTTTRTPGEPCACGTTVTLGPDDYFQTRQRDLSCTTAWKASYGRRSAVESGNAILKVHRGRPHRGSTRVMGTARTGFLLAFIVAAANASLMLTRYGFDVGSPFAGSSSEVLTPLPSPRPALHRTRPFKRRRRVRSEPPRPPGKPTSSPGRWAKVTEADTTA